MPLTEITRPYETLIRHHEDGTTAMQHSTITEISRDGVLVSAVVNSPINIESLDDVLQAVNIDEMTTDSAVEATAKTKTWFQRLFS